MRITVTCDRCGRQTALSRRESKRLMYDCILAAQLPGRIRRTMMLHVSIDGCGPGCTGSPDDAVDDGPDTTCDGPDPPPPFWGVASRPSSARALDAGEHEPETTCDEPAEEEPRESQP